MEPGPHDTSVPRPGWYVDANRQTRWWDGRQWGQLAPPMTPVAAPMATTYAGPPAASGGTDPKTMAMLAQLLGLVSGFVGPLVIYLVNGEKDPFVRHHAAEALNFQLTVLIAWLITFALMLLLVGFLLFPVLIVGAFIFEILATMAASRGEWYRFPINIRMVPGAIG